VTEDRTVAIERTWPYDGPHSAESVTDAARAVSALVRYLNNATGPNGRNLPYASNVGEVVSSIKAGVYGLDQLFSQLVMAAVDYPDQGKLYDDRGPAADPSQTVVTVCHHLNEARKALHPLARALDSAHSAVNHLGHREAGSDD
jgi:hypothetical protein